MASVPIRRGLTLVLVALIATCLAGAGAGRAVASGPSGRASAGSDASSSNNSALTQAVDVRQRFGLRADVAYVLAVARSRGTDSAELGIPLTAREVREMRRRDRVGESLAKLADVVGKGFGGAWIDQQAGGVAVVASTGNVSIQKVAARLPKGTAVRIEKVLYSMATLNSLNTRLGHDIPTWTRRGVQIASVGVFPEENRVRVRLQPGASPRDVEAVKAAYATSALEVVRAPTALQPTASRTATTGPLYGGASIVWCCKGGYEYGCTASTSAKSGSAYYGTTAGHCGKGGIYTQGSDSGDSLGSGARNGFYDYSSSPCDCTVFGGILSKHSNQVIVNGGSLYTYLNYASKTSNLYIGRPACISGARTNADICDKIRSNTTQDPLSAQGHSVTIVHMIEIFCPDRAGDSGAPVGNGPTWLGINSAGYNEEGAYNTCGDINKGVVDASPVMYLNAVTGATPTLPAQ